MKKAIAATFLTATLILSGCGSVNPAEAAQSPQDAWEALKIAAQNKDCDNFTKHTTSRLQMGESDCIKAFTAFDQGLPEIDWDATQYDSIQSEAKIYLTNGRSLTTFIKDPANGWQADTKFWR